MFPISYRDLELMRLDRGVEVDHTTIFRWIQAYAAELERRIRPHLRMSNGSWRVDETYVKAKGRWIYLYRAVDSRGQTTGCQMKAQRSFSNCSRQRQNEYMNIGSTTGSENATIVSSTMIKAAANARLTAVSIICR